MKDGLEAVLNATEEQKEALGTQHTPHEIAYQPASWRRTHQILVVAQPQIQLLEYLTSHVYGEYSARCRRRKLASDSHRVPL